MSAPTDFGGAVERALGEQLAGTSPPAAQPAPDAARNREATPLPEFSAAEHGEL